MSSESKAKGIAASYMSAFGGEQSKTDSIAPPESEPVPKPRDLAAHYEAAFGSEAAPNALEATPDSAYAILVCANSLDNGYLSQGASPVTIGSNACAWSARTVYRYEFHTVLPGVSQSLLSRLNDRNAELPHDEMMKYYGEGYRIVDQRQERNHTVNPATGRMEQVTTFTKIYNRHLCSIDVESAGLEYFSEEIDSRRLRLGSVRGYLENGSAICAEPERLFELLGYGEGRVSKEDPGYVLIPEAGPVVAFPVLRHIFNSGISGRGGVLENVGCKRLFDAVTASDIRLKGMKLEWDNVSKTALFVLPPQVELLKTSEVYTMRGEKRESKTLYDIWGARLFNVSWEPNSSYHTDWSPNSGTDTRVIKSILNPDRVDDDNYWINPNSWPYFAARPGILEINGRLVAVGYHLYPHHDIMGGDPGPPFSSQGNRRYTPEEAQRWGEIWNGKWYIGGHMCMYYGDSTGDTPSCNEAAKTAYRINNEECQQFYMNRDLYRISASTPFSCPKPCSRPCTAI